MSYTVIDYYEDNMFTDKTLVEKLKKKKRKYIRIRNTKSKWWLTEDFYYYQGKIDELTEVIAELEKGIS